MQNNECLEDKDSTKKHWENIFSTKNFNELSWYQEKPQTSLNLIAEIGLPKDSSIIDIGGGDSTLVDNLFVLGYKNMSILDVSSNALERSKKRLGKKADAVKWIVADLREFETDERYDIWHDRAVLHFLTTEEDINKYVKVVRLLLKPDGYLIISTFSEKGPKKCSGLDIKQYSEDSMKKLFNDFENIKSSEEEHITPWGASQIFIYSVFKKTSEKYSKI
ncbi:MAG: class I SAM-dependent methyltransferase [Nanoarchaeota archaeon]